MNRRTWRAALGIWATSIATWLLSCADDGPTCPASRSGRETICFARAGGQTGMEGSCLPMPEPEPFSAEDVRALIEGTHQTTLAYRPEGPSLGAPTAVGLPMTVSVELDGEPHTLDPAKGDGCNLRIQQDVEVTLNFDDPPLDVVIESTAYAFSDHFAVIQHELGRAVPAALGLPWSDVTFSLAFDENGMGGTLDPNDDCGFAVFPADAHCPEWPSVEVSLDRERDGFRPRDALLAMEELGDVPLRWDDGSETTVSVALGAAPDWVCSGAWVETSCPERLNLPLSVRVVTADGRLNAELPAELEFTVATQASATQDTCGFTRTPGELDSLSIRASYVPGEASGDDVLPPLDSGTGFTLHLSRRPEAPDPPIAEFSVFAFEQRDPGLTAPIDATVNPAPASCLVATGAVVERP